MNFQKEVNDQDQVKVIHQKFEDDGTIPNNPDAGALVYRDVFNFNQGDPASLVEDIFHRNNWSNSWRNGIFSYHHYHSNTHEVLGVYSGQVNVQLGGEKGKSFQLSAGDVVIIPAGVAHKNIGSSSDFGCVGAYPGGKSYDMNRDKEDRDQALENIRKVSVPEKDPVYGDDGPLFEYWK